MSYASEQGVLNAQMNAAISAQATEIERQRPFVLLRPRIYPDGDKWCALYGDNIIAGVVGWGDTPELAAADFDVQWKTQKAGK